MAVFLEVVLVGVCVGCVIVEAWVRYARGQRRGLIGLVDSRSAWTCAALAAGLWFTVPGVVDNEPIIAMLMFIALPCAAGAAVTALRGGTPGTRDDEPWPGRIAALVVAAVAVAQVSLTR